MSEAQKEQASGTDLFAAESQGKGGGQGSEKAAEGTGTSTQGVTVKSEEMIPRAQFDKLQADLENFKRIEEERKAKEKKRQEALLAEQGKYKELYETTVKEAEAMKAQLEKLTKVVTSMLEEEMKDLPEDFDKSLIPDIDDYDKVTWLRKAKSLLVAKVEPRKGDRTPPASGEPLAAMRSIYTHPTSPKH